MRRSCTAIVVSFETGPALKNCLYCLLTEPGVGEILVVNNGNPVTMSEWLADFAAQESCVRILHGQGNIGFGAGVNLAARQAIGDDLLVINPDALLRRGSLAQLQTARPENAQNWIVGGRIFDLNGTEERGCRRLSLNWRRVLGLSQWTLETTPEPSTPLSMPVISGAFFLTGRDGFLALDGFDEAYFIHFEDLDLCERMRKSGGQVIYTPHAGALHYGATSGVSSVFVAKHKAKSFRRYFRKHSRGIGRIMTCLFVWPVSQMFKIKARLGK